MHLQYLHLMNSSCLLGSVKLPDAVPSTVNLKCITTIRYVKVDAEETTVAEPPNQAASVYLTLYLLESDCNTTISSSKLCMCF